MNFDRLRHVAERADIGESSEVILGVTIDEKPGSFKNFVLLLVKELLQSLIIVIQTSKDAQVFVGIKTTKGVDEKKDIIKKLKSNGYKCHDMSSNEMAKLHVRYMVGGICNEINDERIYRFMFPEKPGELLKFLRQHWIKMEYKPFPLSKSWCRFWTSSYRFTGQRE